MQKNLLILEVGAVMPAPRGLPIVVAEIGKEILFDAAALDSFDVSGWQPVHYDLLVLCAAVEFADRRWKRPRTWCRDIHLEMSVLAPAIWSKLDVMASLRETLRHLTGDNWTFAFAPTSTAAPIGHRQIALDFPQSKSFAIAYSDGLDSRAVAELSGTREEALCIRVASSKHRRRQGDNYFKQIPFKTKNHGSQESSFRSRGFQFAMITAIAGHLTGVNKIVVPESGQGALGPVIFPLYRIYADYRNHPTFFRSAERLIHSILDYRIDFVQPRLWSTKGQTLIDFLKIPSRSADDLIDTHSCWQKRRIVNKKGRRRKQCGLCAACLLRRMSMHAADISEAPDTYVIGDLTPQTIDEALAGISDRADRNVMIEYGSVGARHLMQLAALATRPDSDLKAHASEIAVETNISYETCLERLRELLAQHSLEWSAFLSAQGEGSFLNSWLEGGRYGRA